ncbi:MAG: hypothetical protein WDZ35_05985 [Crocinitomicaceae bacterium]
MSLFFLRTGTAPVAELVKYDIVNQTETVLCNTLQIAYPPKWGRSGWITFATLQNEVWKIKPDGTQLTQLTFGSYDRSPMFDYSGNRIIYYRDRSYSNAELSANPDLYKEYKMIVIDLNGNTIDSVMAINVIPDNYYQKWTYADFNGLEEVYFIGGAGTSAGIYKMNSDLYYIEQPYIVTLYPNSGFVYGFDQTQGALYYSKYRNGLYRTDIQTGEEVKIRNGCDTKYFHSLTVSEDGSNILAEVVISTVLDQYGSIDRQREIWLIDPHTCNEEKILGE